MAKNTVQLRGFRPIEDLFPIVLLNGVAEGCIETFTRWHRQDRGAKRRKSALRYW